MDAGWRTATIEAIADKVEMGPFGSFIKVETFVPEGVPIISDYSHGGSDLDLVLCRSGPFLLEARDRARLAASFRREIEREYCTLISAEWRERCIKRDF